MFNRVFGAVVPDSADEARTLLAIKQRAGWTNDPLHDDFCSALFAGIPDCPVYPFRDEWHVLVKALHDLIQRALNHWSPDLLVTREGYDWQLGEVTWKEDYPAWAHRAATNLVRWSGGIFEHNDSVTANETNLLDSARWRSGAWKKITDAQLLACLAVGQARFAALRLVAAVKAVDEDKDVSFWLGITRQPEWQPPEARRLLDRDVNLVIDRAALDHYFPEQENITRHRIHAEKLLLLADITATGRVSAAEAGKIVEEMATAERGRIAAESKLSELQEKRMRGPLKGADATRKLTDDAKARIPALAAQRRKQRPDIQEKEIELELAHELGVGRSTIQRALGKKK
jgi:hypothetical protein